MYKGELIEILRLLFQGQMIRGSLTRNFEQEFASYLGIDNAIATGSGRSALHAILHALDLPPRSEIILPAYEDLSVPEIIREAGLVPVFADISIQTQNIDLMGLDKKITDKTRAIIVTHIFGNPLNVKEARDIISQRRRSDIIVIEDCAHALGVKLSGKHVGADGDVSFFSFSTTKPFMCFGGGMVVTNSRTIYERVSAYVERFPFPSVYDGLTSILAGSVLSLITSKFVFSFFMRPLLYFFSCFNIEHLTIYRILFRNGRGRKAVKLANFQALVGLENLRRIERYLRIRNRNALILDESLGDKVMRPRSAIGSNHYFYVIFSRDRDALRKKLLKEGVDTGKNLMRNCASHFKASDVFPNTEVVICQSVQIPVDDRLGEEEMSKIAKLILKHYVL